MQYCHAYGIPRSVFLSWDPEDRAYALAYQQMSNERCNGCGNDLSESTAKENQFAYGGEVVRCHACAARNRTLEKFANEGGDQAGVMFNMTESPEKRT